MKKLKHTPPPWEIKTLDDNCEGEYKYIGPITANDEINAYRPFIECKKEDARLISCAPEILEVLIDFYKNEPHDCECENCIKFKILIEKATGKKIEDILT